MSSLLAQRPLPGSSQGAPATARAMATLHTINQQSGREMLTHLAVIVKQVTAPGADRIWPGGICLWVGCLGLCDLYLGDCAAEVTNPAPWARTCLNRSGQDLTLLVHLSSGSFFSRGPMTSSFQSPPHVSHLITLRNHLAFI